MLYIAIPTYILMACIGFVAAIIYIVLKMKEVKLSYRKISEYIIVCGINGFIGARLLFVISIIPSLEIITINDLLYYLFNGGIVFYGGLIGVILGIVIVSQYSEFDSYVMLNFFTPVFPLFHGFARLGCLLAGCCYGIPWSWGVVLKGEENIVRFPVQLIESVCCFLIFIMLITHNRKYEQKNDNLVIYLCCYSFCRFALEFLRGDAVRGIWFGNLSTAQYISILIFIVCISYKVFNVKKSKA